MRQGGYELRCKKVQKGRRKGRGGVKGGKRKREGKKGTKDQGQLVAAIWNNWLPAPPTKLRGRLTLKGGKKINWIGGGRRR